MHGGEDKGGEEGENMGVYGLRYRTSWEAIELSRENSQILDVNQIK